MFALMLDPRFKRLRVVEEYVGNKAVAERVCKEYTSLLLQQLERAYIVLNPEVAILETGREGAGDDGGLYEEEPHNRRRAMEEELVRFRKAASASAEEDPLTWWSHNATKFPHVAYMARYYLSIPSSQAEVERVLSIAGVFTRLHRVNMGNETLNTLIRINKNVNNDPDEAMGVYR